MGLNMITNDRQYTAAKEKLAILQASSKAPIKKEMPDIIAEATRGQLKEMINEIKGEIKEYE